MEVKNLSFSYHKGKKIIDDLSFLIPEGKITTLLGANGCGKSTLFQLMTKNLKPDIGKVYLNNRSIGRYSLKEFARRVAIVHQNNQLNNDVTVEQLISYGRLPYRSRGKRKEREDYEIIEWAMEVTDILEYRDYEVMSLSGGQRQRVWIAMALAQKTDLVLLDEPTTYLDIRYQIELLELIQKLNKEYGITILMVLHDINHAIYYSDNIIGLQAGKIIVEGDPNKVVTTEILEQLYGIQLEIETLKGKNIVLNVR